MRKTNASGSHRCGRCGKRCSPRSNTGAALTVESQVDSSASDAAASTCSALGADAAAMERSRAARSKGLRASWRGGPEGQEEGEAESPSAVMGWRWKKVLIKDS